VPHRVADERRRRGKEWAGRQPLPWSPGFPFRADLRGQERGTGSTGGGRRRARGRVRRTRSIFASMASPAARWARDGRRSDAERPGPRPPQAPGTTPPGPRGEHGHGEREPDAAAPHDPKAWAPEPFMPGRTARPVACSRCSRRPAARPTRAPIARLVA
jgi:hypothetical protein